MATSHTPQTLQSHVFSPISPAASTSSATVVGDDLDGPYSPDAKRGFVEYTAKALTDDEHDVKVDDGLVEPQSDLEEEEGEERESEKESWLHPRINLFRILCAALAFFSLGMNDGAVGALIPYLQEFYHRSYGETSLIFLTAASGFVLSAFSITFVDAYLGPTGSLLLGISVQFVNYFIQSFAPPYPILLLCYFLGGYGQAIQEGQYSAFIVGLQNTTVILTLLHASYGLGATVSPVLATTLVTEWHFKWNQYFYVTGALVLITWISTRVFYSGITPPKSSQSSSSSMSKLLKSRLAWLTALFLLLYVGAEVSFGGWLVTYMLHIRSFSPSISGDFASIFWGGMFTGRILLAYPTAKFGEYPSIIAYISLTIITHLAFWIHTSAPVGIAFLYVGIIGFLSGPMFSAAISVAASSVPPSMRVSIVGFCSAFGASGAAIFPFLTGAAGGPKVLNGVYMSLSITTLIIWVAAPPTRKSEKKGGSYQALEMDPV